MSQVIAHDGHLPVYNVHLVLVKACDSEPVEFKNGDPYMYRAPWAPDFEIECPTCAVLKAVAWANDLAPHNDERQRGEFKIWSVRLILGVAPVTNHERAWRVHQREAAKQNEVINREHRT